MIYKTILIITLSALVFAKSHAQLTKESKPIATGLTKLPDLTMTDIPGAVSLSQPVLITGANGPLISQGHGLAAPAFYDMDGDGLNDLLIGEFGSGMEFGRYMGNFIRVYRNTGTLEQPEFNANFFYAKAPFQILTNGTPYSVDQFCCIGFTPQFADLNGDGYKDMITGQYYGEVSWFAGSENGFRNGEALAQEGNPRDSDFKRFVKNQSYWSFSSASFGDLTSDGKLDLVVGGTGGLRLSKNIGTIADPKFGLRELLRDVEGNPLTVLNSSGEIAQHEIYPAGDYMVSPYVIDWDNDGVLDLLVTNSYDKKGFAVVDFFRGVKVGQEHRFEKRTPLFITGNGSKEIPGSSPRIFVTDYNNDGIADLLIGTSVVTVQGNFHHSLSWGWEKDLGLGGAGKDPSNLERGSYTDEQWSRYVESLTLPTGVTLEDYLTIRHSGYLYVMLGKKSVSNKTRGKK